MILFLIILKKLKKNFLINELNYYKLNYYKLNYNKLNCKLNYYKLNYNL